MKHSDSIAHLAPALASVQGKIETIPFDAENPHFKSKFASLTAILEYLRPLLVAEGLSMVQGGAIPHTREDGLVTAITVETTLVHSSGEWLSTGITVPLAKSDPQGAGGALTYGRRYSLSALLALATDEDDDGASTSRPAARKPAAEPQRSPSPAPARTAVSNAKAAGFPPEQFRMPFGKSKGKPLGEMETDPLQNAFEWAFEKDKYSEFREAAQLVLDNRLHDPEKPRRVQHAENGGVGT